MWSFCPEAPSCVLPSEEQAAQVHTGGVPGRTQPIDTTLSQVCSGLSHLPARTDPVMAGALEAWEEGRPRLAGGTLPPQPTPLPVAQGPHGFNSRVYPPAKRRGIFSKTVILHDIAEYIQKANVTVILKY